MLPEIDDELRVALSGNAGGVPQPKRRRHRANASCSCWGALLVESDLLCTPGFVAQTGHFKNHFCAACMDHGIAFDASRARESTGGSFPNGHSSGPWTVLPDGCKYRMINQTARCSGRPLLLFKHEVPAFLEGLPVPNGFVTSAGVLQLSVTNGTLVPHQVEELSSQSVSHSIGHPTLVGSTDSGSGGGAYASMPGSSESPPPSEMTTSASGVVSRAGDKSGPSGEVEGGYSNGDVDGIDCVADVQSLSRAHAQLAAMIRRHQLPRDAPPSLARADAAMQALLEPLEASQRQLHTALMELQGASVGNRACADSSPPSPPATTSTQRANTSSHRVSRTHPLADPLLDPYPSPLVTSEVQAAEDATKGVWSSSMCTCDALAVKVRLVPKLTRCHKGSLGLGHFHLSPALGSLILD